MNTIRTKWDSIYNPWFTKILTAIIVFLGIQELAKYGPLSPAASLIFSCIGALFCFWNPGGAALTFIIVLFISTMHVNTFMLILVCIPIFIYCSLGYAAVSTLVITTLLVISDLPDGAYWGAFAASIFMAYKTKEKLITVFYPIFTAFLLLAFGKFGTINILYPDNVIQGNSSATTLDEFIATISFQPGFNLFFESLIPILELTLLACAAGIGLWLLFKNSYLRSKIKNADIYDLIVFITFILIILLVILIFNALTGIAPSTSYPALAISTLLGYIFTRPFASEKVAETLISKSVLNHRKAASITFTAVQPKAGFSTPYVNDDIKEKIRALDPFSFPNFIIKRDSNADASHLVSLMARHLRKNIIKIDYDVFEKLYGEDSENYFKKIFADAKAQAPVIICFNDAEKFFNKPCDELSKITAEDNVSIIFVTDHPEELDSSLPTLCEIKDEILYSSAENMMPDVISKEESIKIDKKIKRKTLRASIVGLTVFALALGGVLYYFFIYENSLYDIHEQAPVETIPVGTIYVELESYGPSCGYTKFTDELTSIMESTDATFYYLESSEDNYITVYQTDEKTFNEMSSVRKSTIARKMGKSIDAFFSLNYEDLPDAPLRNFYDGSIVLDYNFDVSAITDRFDTQFNNLGTFFNEHELVLTCNDTKVEKLAFADINVLDNTQYKYFGIISSNVTNSSCIGEPNTSTVLPPLGETEHLKVYMCTGYDPDWRYYWCDEVNIIK